MSKILERRLVITALVLFLLLPGVSVAASDHADVLLVLDNSGSMKKNDPEFLLKRAVAKFVNELADGTRVGILIFAQDVDYAVPLADLSVTTREAVRASLDKIDYRGQLTNSPAAIERAIYELKTGARADAGKVVIFMTDGIVDTGDPEIDKDKTKWMREELAADAADNDIRMITIAFTENADFFLIQSLAKKTGGEYFRALAPEDLAGVFEGVHEKLIVAEPDVPAAPAPPPVTAPAPALPATPAAGTSCLDTLIPEERAMMEEAAPDAGVTPEQLCTEMMAATPGQPAVVYPAGDDAQVTEEDEKLGLIILVAAGAALLLLVVVVVVTLLRRRSSAVAGGPVQPPPVPDAFVKDINGITGDPATQLGGKPVIVGRVLGTDPAHFDYFVIDKSTIGRRHAIIQYRDFSFWILDQGSVNGTYLNGERIDGERQLKHGDRVKFHKYEFEFSMPEMDDGGHTVFADPNDATMVGDATVMGGTAAFAASEMARKSAAAAPADDLFDFDADDEAATDMPRDPYAEGDETAEGEIPVVEAATPVAAAPPEQPEPSAAAAPPPLATDVEFDAEASAFFDEDDLGQTNGPMAMDDFDEGPTAFPDTPANHPDEVGPAEDFSESETMVPGDVYGDEDALEQTSDISLDEFMRTDTFEAHVPGFDVDDADEDATLMPSDVVIGPTDATSTPAIDDVFDITGEGTVPPVNEDDDDDSEAPTEFRR